MKFDDTLMLLVQKDLENNLIPMLLGEPGIGKSSWVKNLGNVNHTKVFVLACNQLADKADVTGARLVPIYDDKNIIVDYEQIFYPHSTINRAIKYAEENPRENPILFMDELNRTTPDVTSELLSIPTERTIGNKTLPKNLRIMIAGNDKGNVTSLDEASISRFVLYPTEPDVNTFLGLDSTLNPFVQRTLNAHPECIFCKTVRVCTGQSDNEDEEDAEVDINEILDDGDEMNQITTPRTIAGVSRWLNSFTNDELKTLLQEYRTINGEDISVLQQALEGHTGKTSFTKFLLAEIANGLMTINNQSQVQNVSKPACYDQMKACKTVDELNDFVATMTDNDKSGCLVYAIYEKEDNAIYISALAPAIPNLQPNDMKTIIQLFYNDELDETNKESLLNLNCSLTTALSVIMTTQ